jgi:hypothetical protein
VGLPAAPAYDGHQDHPPPRIGNNRATVSLARGSRRSYPPSSHARARLQRFHNMRRICWGMFYFTFFDASEPQTLDLDSS